VQAQPHDCEGNVSLYADEHHRGAPEACHGGEVAEGFRAE
jgi:hypothetical protein